MGVFSVVGGNLVLTDGTLDFENPTDANTDGVYEITVNVFDGNDNYQENFTVSVNDLNDAPDGHCVCQPTRLMSKPTPVVATLSALSVAPMKTSRPIPDLQRRRRRRHGRIQRGRR